ncbi:uncharacterized protein [Typha angustifolia]|uniref:uncharacterized protein isoform X1 n=1 Tax=Typha angustifolia TaxID=59011 RepID=UPI003C304C36
MEYERIHKVQIGVLSPTKLRMKLLGAQNRARKGGSSSSRTSPSKNVDMEHIKNSLLAGDIADKATSKDPKVPLTINDALNSESPRLELPIKEVSSFGQYNQQHSCSRGSMSKEKAITGHAKIQNISKNVSHQLQSNNLSMIHPVRTIEEEGNAYDSGHDNASTSSFEFHHVERTSQHLMAGMSSRQIPSKWNDAEKWIVNRQKMNLNVLKRNIAQPQGSRQMNYTAASVALESMSSDQKHSVQVVDTKRMDSTCSGSQNVLEKFSFVTHQSSSNPAVQADLSLIHDSGSLSRLQKELYKTDSSVARRPCDEPTATPNVQSVSMRDVGTEMTPIPSQDPSRIGTPIGSITPTRSPGSSITSTPRRGEPATSPAAFTTRDNNVEVKRKDGKNELSERELKLKIRKEIAALGVQLGKTNIASWASREDREQASPSSMTFSSHLEKEYEVRAVTWEEAEYSKHMARYRREEVNIQAWENHERANFEAEMRKVEAKAAQMRAEAVEKMAKKLSLTQRLVEEKRAAAQARMNQQAARTAKKVEHIRQTGRIPSTHKLCCSGFF